MDRLGIVPAAGKAERFEGQFKELLPIQKTGKTGGQYSLIKKVIKALKDGGANRVLVVSNLQKISTHTSHLSDSDVYYAIQKGEQDAWSAIVESFAMAGDLNFYAMPDTCFPFTAFQRQFTKDFTLGVFYTGRPERFGVLLDDGLIHDKQADLPPGDYQAWGVLTWSKRVVEFWQDLMNEIESHTQAFNLAMQNFEWETFVLPFYYDIATFEDYRRLIGEVARV